jgi:hypothetical protein
MKPTLPDGILEVKDIRDRARAIADYMKQAGYGLEAQNTAAELKIRAERKLGGLLAETVTPGNPQFSHGGRNGKLPEDITWNQSSRWQLAATVPEDRFEEHVARVREDKTELTTVGVLRIARTASNFTRRTNETSGDPCKDEPAKIPVERGSPGRGAGPG